MTTPGKSWASSTQWALTRKVEEVEEFADRFGFAAPGYFEAKDVYHGPISGTVYVSGIR